MTDPKDTAIEILCEMVSTLRKELTHTNTLCEQLVAKATEEDLERDTYRDENENLRAMIAEFRRRAPDGDWSGPAAILGALDDCEREAFGVDPVTNFAIPLAECESGAATVDTSSKVE